MKNQEIFPVEPGFQPDGTCVHADGQVSTIEAIPWGCSITTTDGEVVEPIYLVFKKTDRRVSVWTKDRKKKKSWQTILFLLVILVFLAVWAFR